MSRLIIIGLLWMASVVATGVWAWRSGRDVEAAAHAREASAEQRATAAASQAAAAAISKIEVRNVTIRQPLQTLVRTQRVFSECRSGNDAVRLLNASPSVQPASGAGQLPSAGATQ